MGRELVNPHALLTDNTDLQMLNSWRELQHGKKVLVKNTVYYYTAGFN